MMQQTKDEKLAEIQSLRSYASNKNNDIAELERRYGTGARPAWVGEEISILRHYANLASTKADEKEAALAV